MTAGVGTVVTSSPVSTRIGDDLWRVYHPGIYPGHSGPLSLAIPPWAGAISTGDGLMGRNNISEVTTLWRFITQVYKYINKCNFITHHNIFLNNHIYLLIDELLQQIPHEIQRLCRVLDRTQSAHSCNWDVTLNNVTQTVQHCRVKEQSEPSHWYVILKQTSSPNCRLYLDPLQI